MSSIDERIVDMRFNNRQFEKGIGTSLKSLEDLKKGLGNVGNGNALSALQSGVDTISSKFTALGIIGVTALQNITNSAINTGKALVKSLTIEPVMSGLQEYETKMNAITTIMTNTKSKGTTLDDVNTSLAELNDYADLTIYNFAEMTRNVGTFTAAGVDLETSVGAIKGIANLAAGSGSNSQQASNAMYQLSQALAEGRMSLQSWNSVVNAGMGGELFQHALIDKAVEFGEIMPEIADQIKSGEIAFRDAISATATAPPKLNITKDMMVDVFNDFANDESLVKAATEVKTFTQLIDTMKESVQSGWAVSWEHIIGSKDDATQLFTAISQGFESIMGSSADARNLMLQFWNENGGRDAVIQALSNAFNGLLTILKPIKDAFVQIFPPMTGERLVEMSESLLKLTENFKIGDETADKLKRTFAGLFALLDMGRQAFGFLFDKVGDLVGALLPGTDGLLGFTAGIGDFIVGLNDAIRVGDVFNNAFDTIKNTVNKIKELFSGFGGIDLGGVKSLVDGAEVNFRPFTAIGVSLSSAFDIIKNVLEKTAPIFSNLASIVGTAFDKLRDAVSGAFNNAGFESVLDLINGGIFAGILLGIKKFMDSISEITNNAGGFLGSITDILDGVKGSLEAYQNTLKAKVLLTIASAIAILAASLVVLSMIDADKLGVALVAMSTLFIELAGTMAVLSKVMAGGNMVKVAGHMTLMAVAILILSSALKSLAELDWEELTRGGLGIGVLAAILVKSADALSKGTPSMIKGGFGLIAFSTAIVILAQAVKQLGGLDVSELAKGLAGVGILMAEVAGFSKIVKPDKLMSTGLAMIAMGAAMVIFAEAVEKMSSLSAAEIAKGLVSIGASLGIMVAALNLMPKDTGIKSAGILILSAALLVLYQAMQNMGGMSWEEIAKSLIVLAGSLTIITIAMSAMTGGLAGAAAMLVMSAALLVLAPALMMLGSMDLAEIGLALLALVGVFVVVGGAAVILAPLTPVIFALAAAIALLGIGVLAIGGGLLAFSAGLTALATAGAAGAAALVVVVTSLLSLIPLALEKLGEGVIAFAKVITDGMPAIMEAIKAIFEGLIMLLAELAPPFLDTVFTFVDELLLKLVEYVPRFVDSGMKILLGFLQGIAENIEEVVKVAIDVIVNFLKGVAEKIPDVVEVGVDIIVALLTAIGEETPRLVDAGFQMMIDFINGLADTVREKTPLLVEAIGNLAGAVIEGLTGGLLNGVRAVIDAIQNVGKALIDGFKNLLGIRSPSTVFNGIAGNIISGLVNGLRKGLSDVGNAAREIGQKVIDKMKEVFAGIKNVASDVVDGLCNGLREGAEKISEAARGVASKALNAAKDFLGVESPSKAFAEVGKYSGEGMVVGLNRMADKVGAASKGLGKTALGSMKSSISKISDSLSGDIDMTPTIRPVVDMNDVEKNLNAVFAKEQSLNVSEIKGRASAVSASANQNGGYAPGGSAITYSININDPVVREDSDLDKIANKVLSTLTRQQRNVYVTKGVRTV